jgi:putative ABC transport system substrate-binding protein
LGIGCAFTVGASPGLSLAQNRRSAVIGFIGGGAAEESAPAMQGLREGLRDLGYIEPGNLTIDTRFAGGDHRRISGLVKELEQAGVEVIVAHAQATLPTVRAERRVPVVFTLSADPAAAGIARELATPENNATGFTLLAAELNAKRLELLREIAPMLRRVSVLYNPQHPGEDMERDWVGRASRSLGFEPSFLPASNRPALLSALDSLRAEPPEALLLLSDGFMVAHRQEVMTAATRARLPVIAGWTVFVEAGALCSYGPRLADVARRPAVYIDRILRGAKPSELPIERPTTLELAVNLDAASQLGLNLPATVLGRADRVVG